MRIGAIAVIALGVGLAWVSSPARAYVVSAPLRPTVLDAGPCLPDGPRVLTPHITRSDGHVVVSFLAFHTPVEDERVCVQARQRSDRIRLDVLGTDGASSSRWLRVTVDLQHAGARFVVVRGPDADLASLRVPPSR